MGYKCRVLSYPPLHRDVRLLPLAVDRSAHKRKFLEKNGYMRNGRMLDAATQLVVAIVAVFMGMTMVTWTHGYIGTNSILKELRTHRHGHGGRGF